MSDHLTESDRDKLRDAWFEYRNEADKFLFTGGAAGVGFCLHQLFSEGTPSCEGLLLLISGALFGVVCALVVLIFKRNADLMKRLIESREEDTTDKLLNRLDWSAMILFALAVVALILSSVVHVFK